MVQTWGLGSPQLVNPGEVNDCAAGIVVVLVVVLVVVFAASVGDRSPGSGDAVQPTTSPVSKPALKIVAASLMEPTSREKSGEKNRVKRMICPRQQGTAE